MKPATLVMLCFLLLIPVGMVADGCQAVEYPSDGSSCPNPGLGMIYGQQFSDSSWEPGMMGYIERQALGNATYEEMESLMEKMMAGTLNETESSRLVQLMNDHPGPYGMMTSRFIAGQGYTCGASPCPMTGGGGCGGTGSSWGIPGWMVGGMALIGILAIVWILVGMFLIVYLARALSKK